jgi:type III secretion system low calcium response chaperone LcrH/SycD
MQGIPNSVMDELYAYGYKFYQAGRLDDAKSFFQYLCVYDSQNPVYMMGLAATLQRKKEYESAIKMYEFAFSLAKNDYRPKLYIGQCYLSLKDKEQARHNFLAIAESDAPTAIKTQAQAYLGTIKPSAQTEESENSGESHV